MWGEVLRQGLVHPCVVDEGTLYTHACQELTTGFNTQQDQEYKVSFAAGWVSRLLQVFLPHWHMPETTSRQTGGTECPLLPALLHAQFGQPARSPTWVTLAEPQVALPVPRALVDAEHLDALGGSG